MPALDKPRNYYLPSDISLIQICENIGFELVDIEYPYLKSPYSNLFFDHFKFLKSLIYKRENFPFWKRMMNLILKK